MNGTPSTWFSGKSAPEDRKGVDGTTIAALVFFVLSPLGALTAIGGYLVFMVGRYSWKVIGGVTGIYAALFVLLGGFRDGFLARYFTPWREAFDAFGNTPGLREVAGDRWFHWVLAQAGLSLLLGGAFATGMTAYKWVRRPAWKASDRRPGPLEVLRLRRNIAAIANGTIDPGDGHTIGTTPDGKLIVQTEDEGKAHTLVAGGSGSGKTTTMLSMIRDDIRKGEAVIFVDLKGAADVPGQLAEWAERYGRKFMHWTIQNKRAPYHGPAKDGPAFYDPIGRGDPSRRKDLLIESQKWDVEYYRGVVANYLQVAFSVADLVPNPNNDSFTDLVELLDTKNLSRRAGHLLRHAPLTVEAQQQLYGQPLDYKWWEWIGHVLDPDTAALLAAVDQTINGMEESERSGIRSMTSRMQVLTRSVAGAWLRKDPEGKRDIDLRKVADEGWVVVFTLDSANYAETARQIGGLIIQDIQTLSSELRHEPALRPTHLYVDEFSAIGSDNILGLLARARDAKIPVTLSTQALADLKKADPDFLDQCMGIVNCFIVHRANKENDAEVLAGLTGKHIVAKARYGIEMSSGMPGGVGTGAATGSGTIEEKEEYVVLPSKIQDLGTGQLVYIANSPKRRVEHPVQVTPEDPLAVANAMPLAAARSVKAEPEAAPVALIDGIDGPAPAVSAGAAPVPTGPAPGPVMTPFAPTPAVPAPGSAPVIPWDPSPSEATPRRNTDNLFPDLDADLAARPDSGARNDTAGPGAVEGPVVTESPTPTDGPEETVPARPAGPPPQWAGGFRSREHVAVTPTVMPAGAPVVPAAPMASAPEAPTVPAPTVPAPTVPAPTVPAPTAPAPTAQPVAVIPSPRPAAPAPVAPAAPDVAGPRRLPVVRPAALTAPWLTGAETDELGQALVPGPVVEDDEDGGAFGAVSLPEDGWGEAVPETGAIHLRRADVAATLTSAIPVTAARPIGPDGDSGPVSETPNVPTTPTSGTDLFPTMTDDPDWSTH